jgi:hypothetical protein
MPTSKPAPDLYQKYFQDRQFERLDLFETIANTYQVQKALYPGSFVHVTPSFVFPEVVYVDSDKQAKHFFSQPNTRTLITARKTYPQEAKFTFHFADYCHHFDEPFESFDLLISQYAGFVGQHCKPYLKTGGFLLANNSHGDSGLAAMDEEYRLEAVFSERNQKYTICQTNLHEYFIPKSQTQPTRDALIKLQKGIGYTKTADAYLFQKIRKDTNASPLPTQNPK